MNDDKIYARIVCDEFGCEVRASLKNNGGKEYIRKDALLEWAKEMKRICKGAEPIDKAYQTVIDKLNSL